MRYRSNRELFDAVASVVAKDVAYRGYLIKHNLVGQTWIEKDAFKVAYAADDADARATIDALID